MSAMKKERAEIVFYRSRPRPRRLCVRNVAGGGRGGGGKKREKKLRKVIIDKRLGNTEIERERILLDRYVPKTLAK